MAPTSGSKSSTEELPATVDLGRVIGPHGLRGQLRVRFWGNDPENLLMASEVKLAPADGAAPGRRFEVLSASPGRRGEVRVALAGVTRREAAEELTGRVVSVRRDQLRELAEEEFYLFQLVGCRAEGGDGRPLGTVREIWSTGAPDVLVIADEAGAEHLVPAALIEHVDLPGHRVVIEVLPGLLATEGETPEDETPEDPSPED